MGGPSIELRQGPSCGCLPCSSKQGGLTAGRGQDRAAFQRPSKPLVPTVETFPTDILAWTLRYGNDMYWLEAISTGELVNCLHLGRHSRRLRQKVYAPGPSPRWYFSAPPSSRVHDTGIKSHGNFPCISYLRRTYLRHEARFPPGPSVPKLSYIRPGPPYFTHPPPPRTSSR